MKKIYLTPLLFLLPFLLPHSSAHAQNTLLYKVYKKKKKPSYIYGTIHIADKRAFDFNDAVMPAFEDSDAFAMEMIPEPSAMFKMMGMMVMKDKTLKDVFDAKEYARLEQYFADSVGQPVTMLNSFKPFFVAATMMQGEFGNEMEEALDVYFLTQAKKQGKELHGLETLEEQMSVVDKMSLEDQKQMVMDILDGNGGEDMGSEKLLEFYANGQLDSLETLLDEFEMGPEFEKEFLTKRNYLMVERMLPILKKNKTFVAVGALHLPGEEGVLNLLQKEGYKVEPLM